MAWTLIIALWDAPLDILGGGGVNNIGKQISKLHRPPKMFSCEVQKKFATNKNSRTHPPPLPQIPDGASLNPLTAKLFNLNFYLLEVVFRRDPQLQVSENYLDLTKWGLTLFKSCRLMSHFIFNIFKMWYLMC